MFLDDCCNAPSVIYLRNMLNKAAIAKWVAVTPSAVRVTTLMNKVSILVMEGWGGISVICDNLRENGR